MGKYEIKDTLYINSCCVCGICFGVPDHFDSALRKSGASFYCPNGHILEYKQGKNLAGWHEAATALETEVKELKTKLARKTHQLEQLQARFNDEQAREPDEEPNEQIPDNQQESE